MKKISLFSLFIAFGLRVLADATIAVNNYDFDKPIFYTEWWPKYVMTFFPGDVFVEFVGNGKSIARGIATDGFFDLGFQVIPGVPDNSTVNFELRAWNIGFTWPGNQYAGSVSWIQVTGSWDPKATPSTPITGPSLAIPYSVSLGYIPEPSSMVLGILGAAALYFSRRMKFLISPINQLLL